MHKSRILIPVVLVLAGIVLAGCTIPESWRPAEKERTNDTFDPQGDVDSRVDVPSPTDIESNEATNNTDAPDVIVPDVNSTSQTEDPVDTGNITDPYSGEPFTIQ